MTELDQVTQMDCLKALTDLPEQAVDVTLTDPPYVNRMRLFSDSIVDGYAALYLACKKTKNYVVFFWSNESIPQAPPGWYEVARHIWHKPDCRSITHYELIIVWSKEYRRKVSRVWSIPILDYRSLRDWKPHPTQKPVRLIRYLLDLYTKEGDVVLDPFVGTGTTAVACKQMRRHFIAIDNDPEYVKMATARLTTRAKQETEQTATGTTTAEETPDEETPMPEEPPSDGNDMPNSLDDNMPEEPLEEALPDNTTPPRARPVPHTVNLSTPRSHHRQLTHQATAKPRRPPKPPARAPPARRATHKQ
jgi:16S rRNA G966 N2-methylase RsmD